MLFHGVYDALPQEEEDGDASHDDDPDDGVDKRPKSTHATARPLSVMEMTTSAGETEKMPVAIPEEAAEHVAGSSTPRSVPDAFRLAVMFKVAHSVMLGLDSNGVCIVATRQLL